MEAYIVQKLGYRPRGIEDVAKLDKNKVDAILSEHITKHYGTQPFLSNSTHFEPSDGPTTWRQGRTPWHANKRYAVETVGTSRDKREKRDAISGTYSTGYGIANRRWVYERLKNTKH
jgi:hypothetical protein